MKEFCVKILRRCGDTLASAILIVAAATGAANAKSLGINVDSSLADYLMDVVCSNEEIDEAALRASPVVQSQIKHHSNMSPQRNFDAFIDGLRAASKCQMPENDVFRFGAVVKNREKFEKAVAYFKERAPEIEAYVRETLTGYVPQDLDYRGDLVLSVVGNSCGGFSMDGRFFLALACLIDSYEDELQTAKVISAHEICHGMQYAFFYPFSEDINKVQSVDDAFDYLFTSLLLEGTAEYSADSRTVKGSGRLTEIINEFAENGYNQLPLHMRFFSYSGEVLAAGENVSQRLKDIYSLGFNGENRQIFYYVGATMAGHLDRTFGRDTLICILKLPPEQFIRGYQAAALKLPSDTTPPIGDAMMKAANRLSKKRSQELRFERCVE